MGSRVYPTTSVILLGIPLFMNKFVFGKPFLFYRSGFHSPRAENDPNRSSSREPPKPEFPQNFRLQEPQAPHQVPQPPSTSKHLKVQPNHPQLPTPVAHVIHGTKLMTFGDLALLSSPHPLVPFKHRRTPTQTPQPPPPKPQPQTKHFIPS